MLDATFTIKDMYEKKKSQAAQRGIDFLFTQDEYVAFYNLRNTERCFYTNSHFKLVKAGGGAGIPNNYPTAERIDESKPYSKENCVWVTLHSNKVKARFIEQQESTKGQGSGSGNIRTLNKIKKVLANPEAMASKMQPYWDAYTEVRLKSISLAEENLKAMQEQQEKKKAEEEKAALQDKFFQEVLFSDYYSRIAKGFMEKSVLCQITIGDMKKMVVRCNRDMITCDVFDSLDDKHLWVVDKTLPVTKENVKVVKESTKIALDSLISEGNLAKVALSLHKLTVK